MDWDAPMQLEAPAPPAAVVGSFFSPQRPGSAASGPRITQQAPQPPALLASSSEAYPGIAEDALALAEAASSSGRDEGAAPPPLTMPLCERPDDRISCTHSLPRQHAAVAAMLRMSGLWNDAGMLCAQLLLCVHVGLLSAPALQVRQVVTHEHGGTPLMQAWWGPRLG